MAPSKNDLEWESHKEELRNLWLYQGWKMKQIQTYMSQNHNFVKSEEQFYRKFTQWRFQKNATTDDWQFIGFRQEKRKRDGKEPAMVSRHDKRIPDPKVRKETSRHFRLSQYPVMEALDPKTPEGITMATPGAEPHDVGNELDTIQPVNLVPNEWFQTLNNEFLNHAIPDTLLASSPRVEFSDPTSLDFIFQAGRGPAAEISSQFNGKFEFEFPVPDNPAMPSANLKVPAAFQGLMGTDTERMAEETRLILSDELLMFKEDKYQDIIAALEPITTEDLTFEFARKTSNSFQFPMGDKLLEYLKICIYLSSNNHFSRKSTDQLVCLIAKTRAFPLLKTLLKTNTTAMEIFMGKLLVSAAGLGEIEICNILIDAGVDLDTLFEFGVGMPTTALYEAIVQRDVACVNLLLVAGSDPNLVVDNQSPLQRACLCSKNRHEIVQVLRQFGADVSPPLKSSQYSPLQRAVVQGDLELARSLLKEGADPNFCSNKHAGTPLQLACSFCQNADIVELLVKNGAILDHRSGYGDKLGRYPGASRNREMDLDSDSESEADTDSDSDLGSDFDYCLDADPWFEEFGFSAMPPVLIAAIEEKWELVQFLLDEGADVNFSWRACKKGFFEKKCSRDQAIGTGRLPLYTPLQAAVSAEDITMTRILLSYGAHVDGRPKGKYGHTPLQIAVTRENERLVKLLLNRGADINAPGGEYEGGTALQAAARHSDTQLLKLLLKEDADINASASSKERKPALQAAIAAGNTEGVEILVESHIAKNDPLTLNDRIAALESAFRLEDKCIKNEMLHILRRVGIRAEVLAKSNNHLLNLLVRNDDHEMVKRLLEYGVSPNTGYSTSSLTPIQEAALQGFETLVKLLIEYGADVNAPPDANGGCTALQAAVGRNRTSIVDLILRSGGNIKSQRAARNGVSAIEAAVNTGCQELIQLLLDKCPDAISGDPTAKNRILALALGHWCQCIEVSVLKLLVLAGASVESNDLCSNEISILQQACSQHDFDKVNFLLAVGAPVNQRWRRSYPGDVTALQAATSRRKIDMVRALLEKGADVNAPANERGGKTALQTAVDNQDIMMVELLIKYGADVNGMPSPLKGRTALQAAALFGSVKLTQYLIAHGANVNAPAAPSRGVTALQGAAIQGHIRIVMILLRHGANIDGPPAIEQGRGAIEGAAEAGRLPVLEILLDKHPNTEQFDITRKRAARLAQATGQVAIERFLLAYRK